jgi:hypothetical protein
VKLEPVKHHSIVRSLAGGYRERVVTYTPKRIIRRGEPGCPELPEGCDSVGVWVGRVSYGPRFDRDGVLLEEA